MGDMQEIVSAAAVDRGFTLLAVLLPVAGVAIGAAIGLRRNDLRRGLLFGVGCGLLGPLNWLLWRLYNAITDRNGLDTVRNFGINLLVFIVIGAVIGSIAGSVSRRSMAVSVDDTNEREGTPPVAPDADNMNNRG